MQDEIKHIKLPEMPVFATFGTKSLLIVTESEKNSRGGTTGINFFDTEESDFHQRISLPVITIGRSSENNVCIQDPQTSRNHAQIQKLHDGWYLDDLDATNGTYMSEVMQITPSASPIEVPPGEWRYITTSDGVTISFGNEDVYLTENGQDKLLVVDDQKTKLPLNVPLQIGRSDEGNDLLLTSPEASRNHATLIALQEGYLIRDRESSNGTFVSIVGANQNQNEVGASY